MKQNKLTKAARGKPCIICGSVGTSVLAHYSGFRQHTLGKGRGIKGNDSYGAPVCYAHHDNDVFTEGHIMPGTEDWPRDAQRLAKSEAQLFYILQWRDSDE